MSLGDTSRAAPELSGYQQQGWGILLAELSPSQTSRGSRLVSPAPFQVLA